MIALGTHMVAKTKSFKLMSNGRWKKWLATLDAHISGTVLDGGCVNPGIFALINKVPDTRRVFLNSKFNFNNSYAKEGFVISTHNIGNNSYSITLPFN